MDNRAEGLGEVQAQAVAKAYVYRWPEQFRSDFAGWLVQNWPIWKAFEREASRIYARGRSRYAARTIIEWLRHETALREVGSEFKINDHYTPDLARLWLCHYPERAGFFEVRHHRNSMARAA